MAEVTGMLAMVPPEYHALDWEPGATSDVSAAAPQKVSPDAFRRYLADRWDVLAIPASASSAAARMATSRRVSRFAFCKKDETLVEAAASSRPRRRGGSG